MAPAALGGCGAAQDDAQAALGFAEGEIRRLLSGRVYLSDLIMTGGLWRITGQQVLLPACANYIYTLYLHNAVMLYGLIGRQPLW